MAEIGGISQVPAQPMQVSAPAAPTQRAAVPKEQPKISKEQFGVTKSTVSLPTTSRSALTQLSSKDQKILMKMGQGSDGFVGKTSQNLQGARLSLQTEVLPRSLLGAGQTIPPAPMRALAAAYGKVFAGRNFDITPKRKRGAKYAESEDEGIEESI